MGLFSKKEKVPEIPLSPSLPSLPTLPSPPVQNSPIEKNLPELPSFPANPKNENLNQEMVKHAVSDNQTPEDNEVVVDMPPQGGTHNIESSIPSPPPIPPVVPQNPNLSIPSVSQTPIPSVSQPPTQEQHRRRTLELSPSISTPEPRTKQDEPIFIRIDKFQAALKDFKQIKSKVKEIESVLRKVKTIKEKEEVEISSWSEDLEKLKARLAEIDSNIFDQI